MKQTRMSVALLLIIVSLLLPIAARAQTKTSAPVADVSLPLRSDTSPPVRTLEGDDSIAAVTNPLYTLPKTNRLKSPTLADPVAQTAPVDPKIPGPLASFDGLSNLDGVLPPDTVGDVGPNHYVQMVNSNYAVYNKNGTVIQAARKINSIWTGFGTLCESQNRGDPIVLYDQWADRWMLSQFAFTGQGTVGPYLQCIAISTNGDPTGSYHRYAFQISNTALNDYPHFGIWPHAYFMTIHEFTSGSSWGGQGVVAFERQKMLAGDPTAQMVHINLLNVNANYQGMLPADADGTVQPPAGSPGLFVEADAVNEVDAQSAVRIWNFNVNWNNAAAATFGVAGNPNTSLPVAAFSRRTTSIPQPGTAQGLDSLGDRLMNRVQYRNFGNYGALVLNHTADVSGQTAIRWYEVRINNGTPSLYQQGTFAPNDGIHRWMASIAMDRVGNIGLGYSASSGSLSPSIWYTARLTGDTLGTLGQGEGIIKAGLGSQTHSAGRWGDYSNLAVDPTDDCTFWFTSEYMPSTSVAGWQTRIGSFKLPTCTTGTTGSLRGTVTDAVSAQPIAGAAIQAISGTLQLQTTTSTTGTYMLANMPSGTYNVTASAFGYTSQTVNNVVIGQSQVTQNFALTPLARVTVTGVVTDAGHGWPLYARLTINTAGGTPITVFTNPQTGVYSVQLLANTAYTFDVQAVSTGYTPVSRSVTTTNAAKTENFSLSVDTSCTAPGYSFIGGLSETFESGTLPSGWSNIDNIVSHATPQTWSFNDPGNRTNLTGSSGKFAILDSDKFGQTNTQDAELRSPSVNFNTTASVQLQFDTDFRRNSDEIVDVDVSTNNGGTWTNVWRKTGASYRGPKHETVNISAQAANQPSVMVRFHFYNNATWEWWWQVDNVQIGSPVCTPLVGGLVIGNVYDDNTGLPLNGATIQATSVPTITANTVATPDDPALPDGFYTLFSPKTGTQSIVASMAKYANDVRTVVVSANAVVKQDFRLKAGKLAYSPPAVTVVIPVNATKTTPVNLFNSGGVSATFSLQEYIGTGLTIPEGLPHLFRDRPNQLGTGGDVQDFALASWTVARSGTMGRIAAGSLANPWVVLPPPPTGVSRPGSAIVDHQFYMVGGESTGGEGKLQRFNPSNGTWTTLAPMAQPVSNVCSAAIGSSIYVVGGSTSGAISTVQLYDTATNTWSIVQSDPLPAARFGAVCTSYNNKLYVFGGTDGTTYLSNAWVYDPAAGAGSRWTALASLPSAASYGGTAVIGSRIFYAGMRNTTADLATVYAYDVAADTWVTYPALQTARGGAGVWAIGKRLYVGGGGWASYLSSVEEYDTSLGTNGTWSYTNPLNVGRRTFAAATDPANGIFYASSGWAGVYLQNAESNFVAEDVPWLSEAPTSGTVQANATVPISLTFNSNGLTVGDYYANIRTNSSTPYLTDKLPVTMIVAQAGVALTPTTSLLAGNNNQILTTTVKVQNQGTYTDTFMLSINGNGWTANVSPTTVGPLAAGASVMVTVSVTVPANAIGNSSHMLDLSAVSILDDRVSDGETITVNVNPLRSVALASSLLTQVGIPGNVVTYTLTVTNTGNITDTFNITLGTHTWVTTATTSVGPLAPMTSATLKVYVAVPIAASSGSSDAVMVTATSQSDPTKSANVTLTTTAGVLIRKIYLPFVIR